MMKFIIFLIVYLLSVIIVRIGVKLSRSKSNKNIMIDSNVTDVFLTLFPLINTLGAIGVIIEILNKKI